MTNPNLSKGLQHLLPRPQILDLGIIFLRPDNTIILYEPEDIFFLEIAKQEQ